MKSVRVLVCLVFGSIIACVFTWPLGAQHDEARQTKNPFAGDRDSATAGKALFERLCQSCHGSEGGGGRAPALNTGSFKRGANDAQLFDVVQNGIPGTLMPGMGLNQTQSWQVVTYLRVLNIAAEETVAGNASAGEMLFANKVKCATCHQVNGHGGRIGPELSTIGNRKADDLRQAIIAPGRREGYQSDLVTIRTKTGRTIRGLRRNEDTFSIQVMDLEEQFHLLRKRDLAQVKYHDRSLMPEDFGKRLSEGELQDLIAYLKTLKVRDLARSASASISGGVAYERIRNSPSEPHNWLTYWADYQGRHYSPLKQINRTNVRLLQAKWLQQPGGGALQSTPLVVDGIMYTTGDSGAVYALDAATGLQLWAYRPKENGHDISGMPNRGVAMLGGRVFVSTGDAYLVALDAKTGRPLWETKLAEAGHGYSATAAPLALKDKVVVGIAGGEFGIRGFLDAYDPVSGNRLWRFYTVPGPGEFGNDTWEGESWKTGGGATWMTATYDPDLDLVYCGVGNPSPDLNGDVRKGDNLFTCSVVALEGATGKLRWHFQFTPHDTRDWDANETPMLVDRPFGGRIRKLMLHANRNAFFYVLDRVTGEFLLGKPFARQTWAKGLDRKGRPIVNPNAEPTEAGTLIYPNLAGATNWQAPSYDPATGWFYFTYREAGSVYVKKEEEYQPGKSWWGGRVFSPNEQEWGGIKAIDPERGLVKWDYRFSSGSYSAGTLATAGGIVFAAARDGNLMAFDSRTGRLLWRFQTGADIHASPMSYAAGGRQYVALAAGEALIAFALPE
jgi:alcohol dehydrogenase (cytochrome c)